MYRCCKWRKDGDSKTDCINRNGACVYGAAVVCVCWSRWCAYNNNNHARRRRAASLRVLSEDARFDRSRWLCIDRRSEKQKKSNAAQTRMQVLSRTARRRGDRKERENSRLEEVG